MRALRPTGLVLALGLSTATARAQEAPSPAAEGATVTRGGCITRLDLAPLRRLRPAVVNDLLPRPLPTCLTEAEVNEFERRLWSLNLFDDVSVTRTPDGLRVALREKWTIIPNADFSTSAQLRDGFYFLSVSEYSFLGRAMELGAALGWAERAPGFDVWLSEHTQNARRVSVEAGVGSWGSTYLFEGRDEPWSMRRSAVGIGLRQRFRYGSSLRVAWGLSGYHEQSAGPLPAGLSTSGQFAGASVRITLDRYTWNDTVPSGLRLAAQLTPGLFVAQRDGDRVLEQRHSLTAQALGALKLSSRAVLMVNAVVEATNPGHPHHSVLVGNVPQWRHIGLIGGIRGLADNVFRNHFHAFGTVELRHALHLGGRWFAQGVAFVDGGVMARSNAAGALDGWQAALSVGGGVRVIPTFLAGVVPRVDAGVLLAPARDWFVRFGLSQYF
jgi:hypothetical protein